jgi:hypothetical protein
MATNEDEQLTSDALTADAEDDETIRFAMEASRPLCGTRTGHTEDQK